MNLSWIKYGILKGLRYRINTVSWFLADVSLYTSIILMYVLLSSTYSSFGTYTKAELGLYISTYFLVNNIFAVFFSEAINAYENSILDGTYAYFQLSPAGILKSFVLLNFNFPALLSTPVLLAVNIYFVRFFSLAPVAVLLYYLSVLFACGILFFLFQSIAALLLLGIRTSALQSAIMQLFSIAEKPDTVFHPAFKKVFTFAVPAFMFSAVPTKILLGTYTIAELAALFVEPFIWAAIYRLVSYVGNKKLQISGY